MALTYLNCFIAEFEDLCVYQRQFFSRYCITWLRYIDDIFAIYGEVTSLETFLNKINSKYATLKFSRVYSKSKLHFLESNKSDKLKINLYMKANDMNAMLLNETLHPKSVIRALPKSQSLRVSKTLTDDL